MERMEVNCMDEGVYLRISKRLLLFARKSGSTCRYSGQFASVNSKMEVLAKQGDVPDGSIYRQHRDSNPPIVITENTNVISKKLK
jgi:hypothetical protein